MTRQSSKLTRVVFAMGTWWVAACIGDTSESAQTNRDAAVAVDSDSIKLPLSVQADPTPQCERGSLEPDLFALPLDGAGVSFGVLKPGRYVLSTTYLRLIDSAAAGSKFWEVMIPVYEDLGKRDGLVALSLGLSFECNSARTLSVWRDDAAMMEFVTGAAHSAAAAAGGELSRGGSVVTHWTGDQTQATWKGAAQRLAEYNGPIF